MSDERRNKSKSSGSATIDGFRAVYQTFAELLTDDSWVIRILGVLMFPLMVLVMFFCVYFFLLADLALLLSRTMSFTYDRMDLGGTPDERPPRSEPGATTTEKNSLRCAYCRDALNHSESVACPHCRTVQHSECAAELGHCPTLGCPAHEGPRPKSRARA